MTNEQWLVNGDCSKCRKRSYCKKQCTARRRFMQRAAVSTMTCIMAEAFDKVNKGKVPLN